VYVRRSDDLEGLELWAPKLSMLGLRACYSIDHVRLMDDPPGTQPRPLTVRMCLLPAHICAGFYFGGWVLCPCLCHIMHAWAAVVKREDFVLGSAVTAHEV
jgi:hypothetical protein